MPGYGSISAENTDRKMEEYSTKTITDAGFLLRAKELLLTYVNHPEAYWPTLGFLGVQMSWAVQISYVSATLLTLGLSEYMLSYAWLAGPVAGIIMQPLVGVYSDYSENAMGRRRPFIIVGTVCTVIGLQGFSNAQALGLALGDTASNTSIGLGLAIFFFFFLDFSINMAMGPMVALLADTTEVEVYAYGQAWFAAHNGIGKTLGYGFGALSFMSIAAFAWLRTEVRALFLVATIVVLISCTLMVVNTPEKPHVRPEGTAAPSCCAIFKDIWTGMATLPKEMHMPFWVQCCAYAAWFTTFIYGSTWMGEVIFGGSSKSSDPTYEKYLDGVEAASFGYMGMAMISSIWSLVLPSLGKAFGVRIIWALNLVLFAIILVLFTTVKEGESQLAIFYFSLLGFPLAATYQIPWAIVTVVAEETPDKVALFTTVFNMSQCWPEVVISLIASYWIKLLGGKMASAFILGSIAATIGAALCYFVTQPLKLYDRDALRETERPQFGRDHSNSFNSNTQLLRDDP